MRRAWMLLALVYGGVILVLAFTGCGRSSPSGPTEPECRVIQVTVNGEPVKACVE